MITRSPFLSLVSVNCDLLDGRGGEAERRDDPDRAASRRSELSSVLLWEPSAELSRRLRVNQRESLSEVVWHRCGSAARRVAAHRSSASRSSGAIASAIERFRNTPSRRRCTSSPCGPGAGGRRPAAGDVDFIVVIVAEVEEGVAVVAVETEVAARRELRRRRRHASRIRCVLRSRSSAGPSIGANAAVVPTRAAEQVGLERAARELEHAATPGRVFRVTFWLRSSKVSVWRSSDTSTPIARAAQADLPAIEP